MHKMQRKHRFMEISVALIDKLTYVFFHFRKILRLLL